MVVLKTVEKTCKICNKKFLLTEHPSGLVFQDTHFICGDCSSNQKEEPKIEEFTKTTMQHPTSGMPIALWLIHEQNKDKTMMTFKNK